MDKLLFKQRECTHQHNAAILPSYWAQQTEIQAQYQYRRTLIHFEWDMPSETAASVVRMNLRGALVFECQKEGILVLGVKLSKAPFEASRLVSEALIEGTMSLKGQELKSTPVKQLGEWWTHNAGSMSQYWRPRFAASLKRQNYSLRGLAGTLMFFATVGFWVQLPFHDGSSPLV